jgi:predicted metal-dependent HD superfamily phosphohydrolase
VLKNIFFELGAKYTKNQQLIQTLWTEIEKKYAESSRHYHTLSQLENLISQLEEVKDQISDWDPVLFAVFYHDIVYKATRNNNEEKSTELAAIRLHEMNFPENKISACAAIILATKKHLQSGDNDTDLFIDADLSILGQSWDQYSSYFKQIRKELFDLSGCDL